MFEMIDFIFAVAGQLRQNSYDTNTQDRYKKKREEKASGGGGGGSLCLLMTKNHTTWK